jgi:hypothetical protein
MARVDDFDAFYHATRRTLLHQTYAFAGDVTRAADAVERAYARAWNQWRRVRHLPDPQAWVRVEAWRSAGGVRAHRPRQVLVLHHLAGLPIDRVAHEVGISESEAASLLVQAEQRWGDGATPMGTTLARLDRDISGVHLTRAPSLRRSGKRRSRRHTLAGLATAGALVVGAGLLVVDDGSTTVRPAAAATAPTQPRTMLAATATPSSPSPTIPETFLLDRGALLTPAEIGGLTAPTTEWSITSTTDGTTGDPIYAACQRQPFADPDGNQALLRRFASDDARTGAVQVIEESRSEAESAQAFATMEGWYARCHDDGVQLVSTLDVRDLGDEARAFELHDLRSDTYLTVGLVRTGPITGAVVASTSAGQPVPAQRVLGGAAVSANRICLSVSGDCSTDPRVRPTAPLPAKEHPGFLSAFDLPEVSGGVAEPWVGTDPAPSPNNPAATPCERASFGRAQDPRTRVFVLPTAQQVPRRFGVTETIGTFPTRTDARDFVRGTYADARRCPDRELGASNPRVRALPGGHTGRAWRFEFEVNENNSVVYRVGVVRDGSRVAVVSMSPLEAYDVASPEFTRLVVRAGERLDEAETPADAASAPTTGTPTPEPAGSEQSRLVR